MKASLKMSPHYLLQRFPDFLQTLQTVPSGDLLGDLSVEFRAEKLMSTFDNVIFVSRIDLFFFNAVVLKMWGQPHWWRQEILCSDTKLDEYDLCWGKKTNKKSVLMLFC